MNRSIRFLLALSLIAFSFCINASKSLSNELTFESRVYGSTNPFEYKNEKVKAYQAGYLSKAKLQECLQSETKFNQQQEQIKQMELQIEALENQYEEARVTTKQLESRLDKQITNQRSSDQNKAQSSLASLNKSVVEQQKATSLIVSRLDQLELKFVDTLQNLDALSISLESECDGKRYYAEDMEAEQSLGFVQ